MDEATFRIWLQPGVKQVPPGWGLVNVIAQNWFSADGLDVTVKGDGADLENHLDARRKFYSNWHRREKET